MSAFQITPWRQVTDDLVMSWSVINLLHQVSYELVGNATRVFSKTEALAQGSYGSMGRRQKEKIDSLMPHVTRVMHAAQQMTLWLDMQRGEAIATIPNIPDADKVLSWSPHDLVQNIHTELQENIPTALENVRELVSGTYGFVAADQEKMIKLLHRDICRTGEVLRCLALWLQAHDKDIKEADIGLARKCSHFDLQSVEVYRADG